MVLLSQRLPNSKTTGDLDMQIPRWSLIIEFEAGRPSSTAAEFLCTMQARRDPWKCAVHSRVCIMFIRFAAPVRPGTGAPQNGGPGAQIGAARASKRGSDMLIPRIFAPTYRFQFQNRLKRTWSRVRARLAISILNSQGRSGINTVDSGGDPLIRQHSSYSWSLHKTMYLF